MYVRATIVVLIWRVYWESLIQRFGTLRLMQTDSCGPQVNVAVRSVRREPISGYERK